MSNPTENWFQQTNKYKYLELMCIMTCKDVNHLEGNPWCAKRNWPVGGRKKVRKI